MGNCECLRGEKDTNEINVHIREKDYNEDYENTTKGKARAGNQPFSMIDDEEEDKNKLKTVQEKDEEPPVKEHTFIYAEDEIKPEDIKVEEKQPEPEPEPIKPEPEPEPEKKEPESEDDFQVTFKKDATTNAKQMIETYTVAHAYVHEAEKEPEPQYFEPAKPQVVEERAENPTNTSYLSDSDIEGMSFDSVAISKALFNLLNSVKVNPNSLVDKLQRFDIPSTSSANESDKNTLLATIDTLSKKKGKTYLWNEKGFNAMKGLYQKQINGEQIDDTIEEAFDRKAQCVISQQFTVKGKYDTLTTLLLLLLENSAFAKNIIGDSAPLASICSVQGKTRKVLTAFVFATKKK